MGNCPLSFLPDKYFSSTLSFQPITSFVLFNFLCLDVYLFECLINMEENERNTLEICLTSYFLNYIILLQNFKFYLHLLFFIIRVNICYFNCSWLSWPLYLPIRIGLQV